MLKFNRFWRELAFDVVFRLLMLLHKFRSNPKHNKALFLAPHNKIITFLCLLFLSSSATITQNYSRRIRSKKLFVAEEAHISFKILIMSINNKNLCTISHVFVLLKSIDKKSTLRSEKLRFMNDLSEESIENWDTRYETVCVCVRECGGKEQHVY
jgi:hypothetical protein